jgi:iron complex outermembrane receptor protein
VAAAVGSVVRTADPNERFSDRIPSTRSQLSTEFVGNPALDPERCTQLDLWLEAKYPRATFFVSGFARRIGNYITLMPSDLPRRMETSPMDVFQYANGRATFHGAEAGAAVRLSEPLLLRVTGSVLRGTDEAMDEPAPGVSPARADATLRFEPPQRAWFVEGTVRAAARQGRVSMSRGEMDTPGWATLDLQAGREIARGVSIRVGVNNALDGDYVNHLNALDPYTMMPVPEPGRGLFVRLGYGF